MPNTFSRLSEHILTQTGQDSFRSDGGDSNRIVYPAIVRDIEDQSGQNRIRAEIINKDADGNLIPGRDRNIPIDKLPICIPLLSEFLHVRPKVGEQVLVILENPTQSTSARYWMGPVINSQIKLPYQSYQDSISIFNIASYDQKAIYDSPTLQTQATQAAVLPNQQEISIQGREDADIVLRPREIEIKVGKFKLNSVKELNNSTPCRIQLRQVDSLTTNTGVKSADQELQKNFSPFSQLNIQATNINLISTEGKFREYDSTNKENTTNPRLKDYGDVAQQLHPAVFGDELIAFLELITQFLLTHIHTPQSPALSNSISAQIEPYVTSGKLQNLLSNHIRIN